MNMTEEAAIQNAAAPRTRESLARDLNALGLGPGLTVIVHSSLSALGWVSGGPVTVVQALMDVITPEGTLVMPTHSGDYSDPSQWRNPPVPAEWWPIIRETMPAFDPAITPTRKMGCIVETFRTWPKVRRSSHPQTSFAAWGKHADFITARHSLDHSLGEQSPLARIYDLDGRVLLLGVPYGNNTSFHLGEYRAGTSPALVQGAPVMENGQRHWKEINDVAWDSDRFDELGADFERVHPINIGRVGSAESRLFSQRLAVDFAREWLKQHSDSG